MSTLPRLPIGTQLSFDIEERPDRPQPYRARIRWVDPATHTRPSRSSAFADRTSAEACSALRAPAATPTPSR